MTVDVEVNGRMRAVSVERTKGRDPATNAPIDARALPQVCVVARIRSDLPAR